MTMVSYFYFLFLYPLHYNKNITVLTIYLILWWVQQIIIIKLKYSIIDFLNYK